MALSGKSIDCVRLAKPIKKLILDLDSSVSEAYGQQEGSEYNGYFRCECYHPIFFFNQDGDMEAALLRSSNVASAHDWPVVLVPLIDRYRDLDVAKLFRGDAGFAIPHLYELLEDGCEGCPPRAIRYIPDGRGGGVSEDFCAILARIRRFAAISPRPAPI